MNTIKVLTYEAGKVNVPAIANKELSAEYENQENEYLVFIQTDLLKLCTNTTELYKAYIGLLKEFNLPMATYAYYNTFNSVLNDTLNIPNPCITFTHNNKQYDIVRQPAYGFMILNIGLLKEKKILLDESYPGVFYIQDLAEKCFQAGLWISNNFFIELHESWKLFKEHKPEGYMLSMNIFQEEAKRYNSKKYHYIEPNEFLDKLKKFLNGEVTISTPSASLNNQASSLTVDLDTLNKIAAEGKVI